MQDGHSGVAESEAESPEARVLDAQACYLLPGGVFCYDSARVDS